MSRQLTQEIYREDCVGDSSAKHNFNLMSLDTNVCNISSEYFIVPNNINYVFSDFLSNVNKFDQATTLFLNPIRFNLVSATVNTLSSYWNKHEFSVHYPLNITSLFDSILEKNCPTINQTNEKLISLAKTFLNKNYPANSYLNDTYANVIFFLYNVPVNASNPNDLITKKTSPEFSYSVRHMYAEFLKQDIHLGNGKIFKFKNENSSWIHVVSTIGSTDSTKQPSIIQAIPPRVKIDQSPSGRSQITLTITENSLNFDLYREVIQTGRYFMGISDITLIINSGIYLGSTSKDVAALTVSGFTVGDTISIINNGNVLGYGGAGGSGQSLGSALTEENNGKDGGTAIKLLFPVKSIVNNGIISGGGGGGAGGIASNSDTSYLKNYYLSTNKKQRKQYENAPKTKVSAGNGGGGGAGFVGGAEGAAGIATTPPPPVNGAIYLWTISFQAKAGNAGTFTSGGLGGNFGNTGIGGNGGSLGQDGTSTGAVNSAGTKRPPFGGKAGAAIKGKNYLLSITTTNTAASKTTGDVRGSIE